MAADTTYPSVVQVRQDGNMAVPTGQYIDIESGAALLYAAGGTAQVDYVFLADERVKIAIAQGGNVKSGTFYVTVG